LTQKPQSENRRGGSTEDGLERTARHWGATRSDATQTFWKAHPVVGRHVHRRVTGNPNKATLPYIFDKYFPDGMDCGLSLACGHGGLERQLIRRKWARQMHGLDISPDAIDSAREKAKDLGLQENIEYRVENFNTMTLPERHYDAVFSFSASHHCAELEHLFGVIQSTLKDDGLFLINEYLGPSQFQLPDDQVELINEVLGMLPKKYRRLIGRGEESYKSNFKRISVADLEAIDPSEAIRSAEIRTVFKSFFDVVEYSPYGGNLLHFLLAGIVGNFDPDSEVDVCILRLLSLLEERLEAAGSFESDSALLIGTPKRSG
jgi:SAM-dependent methyltransferase